MTNGIVQFGVFWAMTLVLALGLVSTALFRATQRGGFRALFMVSLGVVGVGTMFAYGCSNPIWPACGGMLSIMAVVGTLDLGGTSVIREI